MFVFRNVMRQFRTGQSQVLIATDVAARGLDISTIRTVLCYDMARDIETYTFTISENFKFHFFFLL